MSWGREGKETNKGMVAKQVSAVGSWDSVVPVICGHQWRAAHPRSRGAGGFPCHAGFVAVLLDAGGSLLMASETTACVVCSPPPPAPHPRLPAPNLPIRGERLPVASTPGAHVRLPRPQSLAMTVGKLFQSFSSQPASPPFPLPKPYPTHGAVGAGTDLSWQIACISP